VDLLHLGRKFCSKLESEANESLVLRFSSSCVSGFQFARGLDADLYDISHIVDDPGSAVAPNHHQQGCSYHGQSAEGSMA